jgi:hypothetical protein
MRGWNFHSKTHGLKQSKRATVTRSPVFPTQMWLVNFPDSDETILGHLAQMQQNVQSTKPQLTPCPSLPLIIESPTPLTEASQEVFLHVYPTSKLYTDDTVRFSVWARLGNQYVMIAYHMDGNLILQQAFQIKADKYRIPAFNTIIER